MSQEKMKVLELLQNGKISVDEAERLLKAIGETEEECYISHQVPIPNIKKIIRETLRFPKGMGRHCGMQRYDIENPKKVSIKTGTGNLELSSTNEDSVGIEVSGMHTIHNVDDELSINIGYGDAEIELPHCPSIDLKIGTGDVEIDSIHADSISLMSGTGDVEGSIFCKSATIVIGSGDIDLSLKKYENARITVGAGDVNMDISGGGLLKISAHPDAHVDLPEESVIVEEKIVNNVLKLTAKIKGDEGREITLTVGKGNITITAD